MHTTMTHFGSLEELGLGVSLGLGGGWDWLKNSRTCNTKYNRHACINTKKNKDRVSTRHHSQSMRRSEERAVIWLRLAEK